jgi:hypothetical protein
MSGGTILDLPDYPALQKALRERTVRYCMAGFTVSAIGLFMLFFVYFFMNNDSMKWLFAVSLCLFLAGAIFGASPGLYLSGIYSNQAEQEITDSSYYSPGTRPSITELRIDAEGIFLKFYDTNTSGAGSGISYEFRKTPYRQIKAIYPVLMKYSFYSDKPQFALMNIETTDRKIGHVDMVFHRGDIILKLLEKNFGERWREVFHENEPLEPFHINTLHSKP